MVIESGRLERGTRVQIMPDIVTVGNTRLQLKEGENFTLKCDVLPGIETHAPLQEAGCGSAFIGSGSRDFLMTKQKKIYS